MVAGGIQLPVSWAGRAFASEDVKPRFEARSVTFQSANQDSYLAKGKTCHPSDNLVVLLASITLWRGPSSGPVIPCRASKDIPHAIGSQCGIRQALSSWRAGRCGSLARRSGQWR